MAEESVRFPEEFIFGTATASYQIEGGVNEGGRAPSVWDTFSHSPGKVRHGHTGDVACDHYHRYPEDVRIMRSLGLDAYRFSIAWPRVIPQGRGKVNEAGIDFYSRLVDSLLEAGITPYVTLFHWDLPQALQDRYAGFADRASVDAFADYAHAVVNRLGDRVKHWITFNEPWVYAIVGHLLGMHAPGRKNPWAALRVVHNQLLAHGEAVRRIRSLHSDARVGITLNLMPIHPQTDRPRDRRAADMADQFINRLFLDPLFHGRYPEKLWRRAWPIRPRVTAQEMELIGEPLDFLGINNYTREWARFSLTLPPFFFDMTGRYTPESEFVRDGVQYTSMGWEVYPEGLYELLTRIRDRYGNPPVYITENGAAFNDRIDDDGRVHDSRRTEFLQSYTARVSRALSEGCDVRGYFVWSLLDNFEWAEGYDKRFGLVYVDYESQRRIIKDSGYWYRDFIAAARKPAFAIGEE
jgi:beta-glucosidase